MSNLRILLKNSFLKFVNVFRGKDKKKSVKSGAVTLCVCVLGVLALYTFQAYSMIADLSQYGFSILCLFNGLLITTSVVLILGVSRTAGNKKSKDEDLLLSMPIKKRDIVLSKTLSKYIFDFCFVFVLFMPYFVLYEIFEGFKFIQLLCALLVCVIMPLLSVGLTFLCDFVIAKLFNKTKYANFLKTMMAVLILVLVMLLMFLKTFAYGNAINVDIDSFISDRIITSSCLHFILNQNIEKMFIILGITILPFVLGLMAYSKTLGSNEVKYQSKIGGLKFHEPKREFSGLLKKEFNYYLTNPTYATNTIIAPVMSIALAIIVAIEGLSKICAGFGVVIPSDMFVGVVVLIECFMFSTACISASGISLEGKAFWIIKSMPININKFFIAKILLNLTICGVPIVISSIIYLFALKLTLVKFLLVLFIPLIFVLLLSALGLFINLCLPKLKWEDDVQVFKQSLSVVVTMLLGMVISLIQVGAYFMFRYSIDLTLICLIVLAIYMFLTIAILFLTFTSGKTKFNKLHG